MNICFVRFSHCHGKLSTHKLRKKIDYMSPGFKMTQHYITPQPSLHSLCHGLFNDDEVEEQKRIIIIIIIIIFFLYFVY